MLRSSEAMSLSPVLALLLCLLPSVAWGLMVSMCITVRRSARYVLFSILIGLLAGCGGPEIKVQEDCNVSAQSCAYTIQKPFGERHFTPHAMYFDELVRFRLSFAQDVRISPVGRTRVPYNKIHIRSNDTGTTPISVISGFIVVDYSENNLTIELTTEGGQFKGNGIYSLGGAKSSMF